jgi:succinate dehydrogenase / fumarate reductase iron-sulfur subunit
MSTPLSKSGAANEATESLSITPPNTKPAWWCWTWSMIQAAQANDMAVRWNCKAGKCGSFGGDQRKPRLMCMTRLNQLDLTSPLPSAMKTFPHVRIWSRTFLELRSQERSRGSRRASPTLPMEPGASAGRRRSSPGIPQVHRVLPMPGCVPRFARSRPAEQFIGPRFLIHTQLEMNPLDTGNRLKALKDEYNIGYCNITKCCTKVTRKRSRLPTHIIPLKSVVDEFYDPLGGLSRCSSSRMWHSFSLWA